MTEKYKWSDKLFLVVEDDPASSLLLEIILSKTGAKLLFSNCGEKAIEIVRSTKNIDLVLMDIQMNGMNGIKTTSIIKMISPDLPIIAQTACVVYGDRERCLQAGCSAYITKPIITEVLLDAIEKELDSSHQNLIHLNSISSN